MFTEQQLEHIKSVARKKKGQGEISVWLELANTTSKWQPEISSVEENDNQTRQLMIIKYCAEECKRQHSGALSVYDMIAAWDFASRLLTLRNKLTIEFIALIGEIVEPIDNKNGFRTIPIGVSDPEKGWIEKSDWRDVPRLLELLLDSYYSGVLFSTTDYGWGVVHNTAHGLSQSAEDQFYFEYENIHPFRDGNGRSGKVIFNYLKGTLDNPQMPPNFFGGSNP